MSPGELKDARRSFGLTAEELGRLLGFASKSISRYEMGHRPIPQALAILVRLLVKFRAVRAELGVTLVERE